jgi:hypothetical protein
VTTIADTSIELLLRRARIHEAARARATELRQEAISNFAHAVAQAVRALASSALAGLRTVVPPARTPES